MKLKPSHVINDTGNDDSNNIKQFDVIILHCFYSHYYIAYLQE